VGIAATLALLVAAGTARASFAATYVVNTTTDAPAGASECRGAPGDCSLRQALDSAVSGDVVQIPASAEPYVIAHEKIPVRGGVTIAGAGDGATTISGGEADQAFLLEGAGPVAISGLTITETFNDSGLDEGGAITVPGVETPLTLEDVTISDSTSGAPKGFGGAIETFSDLTVMHSRFVSDSVSEAAVAGEGGGGAIDLGTSGHTLRVSDSVFIGDTTEDAPGGAILIEAKDSVSISSSTFIRNSAGGGYQGGAIESYPHTAGTISNSTLTANAAGTGGAINVEGGSLLTLRGDTIAGNAAEVGANIGAKAIAEVTLENTIIATPPAGVANCSRKVTTHGHNLEDASPSSCGLLGASADLIGVSPQLLTLGINSSSDETAGGPPATLALSPSSPAIGAGSAAGCEALGSVDERGFPRPGIEGGGCDIGAYEILPAVPTSTTLSASGGPGQVTARATVASLRGLPAAVPAAGGIVEIREGEVSLGSAPIGAGGQATVTLTGLAAGEHTLTAAYPGDAVHASSSSTSTSVTVLVPPAPDPEAGPPAPVLSRVTETHRVFAVGRRLATLARRRRRARRPPVGTGFAFTLNTPAAVTLSFASVRAGRLVKGRCVAVRRNSRRGRPCRRLLGSGSLTFANAHAGANVVTFQGWTSRRHRLAAGRYAVTIVAVNAAGRSQPKVLTFSVGRG
jgi:hypothetical protein